jgi:hypothetical protein
VQHRAVVVEGDVFDLNGDEFAAAEARRESEKEERPVADAT